MNAMAHRLPDDRIPVLEATVGGLLRDIAGRSPDRTALLVADGTEFAAWTYGQLLAAAEQAAQHVLAHAAPGDRIAVWSANSLDWVLLEYGCALSGTIVTGFNTAWTDAEVAHALAVAEPAALYTGTNGRGIDLFDRAATLSGNARRLAEIRDTVATASALPSVDPGDPFLVQFTSGTTGRAKAAVLSHRAALNGARVRIFAEGPGDDEVWLNAVPMHHIGGSIHVLLGALSVGGASTVLERFDAGQLVALMGPTGATRMGGVPTMWVDILDRPDFPPPGTCVKTVVTGGSSVPAALVRRIEAQLGATVSIAYGQSEHPTITATLPHDTPEVKATTVGRPLPGCEVKIVDLDTGATVEVDTVGELCVRSPMAMSGYFRDPEATAAAIDADGFLHTGDLCSMDDDGVVRVHGRAREVVIRGGENVYPAEVEGVLLEHPDVTGAAVVGVPDDRLGQQVAAFVLLRDDAAEDAAELEQFVAARLAPFKVPRTWRFVDSFPMTASGKVRKVELEARLNPSGCSEEASGTARR
jgi:fatty-acyl-CoA synthase